MNLPETQSKPVSNEILTSTQLPTDPLSNVEVLQTSISNVSLSVPSTQSQANTTPALVPTSITNLFVSTTRPSLPSQNQTSLAAARPPRTVQKPHNLKDFYSGSISQDDHQTTASKIVKDIKAKLLGKTSIKIE